MNMEPKSLNEWWDKQPDELKQAFTFFPDERWEEADLYLRINIRNYCCLKKKITPRRQGTLDAYRNSL